MRQYIDLKSKYIKPQLIDRPSNATFSKICHYVKQSPQIAYVRVKRSKMSVKFVRFVLPGSHVCKVKSSRNGFSDTSSDLFDCKNFETCSVGRDQVSNSQLPIFLNRALYKMHEGHLTHNFLLISQTKILNHVDRKVNVNEKILPNVPPVFLKHMIFIQKLMAQKIVKPVQSGHLRSKQFCPLQTDQT